MMPACPHCNPAPSRPRELAASDGFGSLTSAPAVRRPASRFFCLEAPLLWKSAASARRPTAPANNELPPAPADTLRP